MRQIVLAVITFALLPGTALAAGCLADSTVVGQVEPMKPVPPNEVPGQGAALYWFFHTWCHTCRDQAPVIKAFRAQHGEVQVYAVPLSGSESEVKRFLAERGLGSIPTLREASDAFGSMQQHPVMIFRKAGGRYYRVNGYTEPQELTRLYRAFKAS
jgi:thiol-disulfide isomerase/thioredoxin